MRECDWQRTDAKVQQKDHQAKPNQSSVAAMVQIDDHFHSREQGSEFRVQSSEFITSDSRFHVMLNAEL